MSGRTGSDVANGLDRFGVLPQKKEHGSPAWAKPTGTKWECGRADQNMEPQSTAAPATVCGERPPATTGASWEGGDAH